MYADKITASMQKQLTKDRLPKNKQINFNTENNQVPQALNKKNRECFYQESFGGL
jgi:excinuclease ABC subunit B